MRDPDGGLVYANDGAASVLGFSSYVKLLEASSEGLSSAVEVADEAGRPVPAHSLPWMTCSRDVEPSSAVFRFRARATGEERIALVRTVPIRDENGHAQLQVSTFTDITERKRMEEALRESERRYRSLFENSADVIFLVTMDGLIMDVNEAALEVFGYARQELVGTSIEKLYVDPSRRKELLEKIYQDGIVKQYEVRFRRRDGQEIDCLKSAAVYRRPDGSIEGYQSIIHDITERERAQEQENEARLRFLSVLAHELRTPLSPLLTSAGMLQEVLPLKPGSIESKLLDNLLAGARILKEHIDDLLDVAAFQAGRFSLMPSWFAPRQAIEETWSFLAPEAEKKGQKLTLDVPRRLPDLKADRRCFQQVLQNLLLNAMKFSPIGTPITLRVRTQGTSLLVHVKDLGPGISKEEQARLFQPYFRAEQDRQRFPGMGLGLALSRQIVEAHGGRIWVESGVGQGAVFSFSLPLAVQDAGAQ